MHWTYKEVPDTQKVNALSEALHVSPLVAALLVQRGVESFEAARLFFRPTLEDLHDPFLMRDMDAAVARVEAALQNGERILVFGDYDVDGTTAVALMSSYLDARGAPVATYIPDRYAEGYGLSYQGIDFAADNEMGLIIALDCGVKALDHAAYAAEKGIDLIVCDHHRPGDSLPRAVAVLDPKRPDCEYPYKELCGCGVGFKLIQALEARRGNGAETLLPYLDLVAIAIGADIVPITGENRVLTFFGLQVINTDPRPGIQAMINALERDQFQVSDLVFQIAPRLNAAGRMQHGQEAVALLTEKDPATAARKAAEIDALNAARKETDQAMTDQALEQIHNQGETHRMSTVVYREDWHKGVIGIVASRLIETYYRPTLVFTRSGDKLAASARSVRGFDIYAALESCSDCLEQFGGHTYAAGLTLEPERYEEFKARFEAEVSRSIPPESLTPQLTVDLPIQLDQIDAKLVRILRQFAPFGPGNPSPVFSAGPLQDTGYARTVGGNGDHLKLAVTQGGAGPIGGIGFGLGHCLSEIERGKPFEAAFSIEENHWQGQTRLQLKVKDLRPYRPGGVS
ncbi:single-stranded-DNA-specific exonuclease RecJ [Robiginitalea sp. M366]|uniref:single-stranded-DNA-specific exonuclease RecJ n=1 Tax=Robiginitalea aestuariiviva TaxID=3036903 RepID=UPI00240D0BA4|nr:single-stranded-DNA-specific exonuclease RecJ [Robiginitalea aestuariiviva]MDG1571590.1 single-stranded-DNA-specific exonuclease RecJ [Robiginitalea aestuariiviva]